MASITVCDACGERLNPDLEIGHFSLFIRNAPTMGGNRLSYKDRGYDDLCPGCTYLLRKFIDSLKKAVA